jgi:hypothetical protein
MSEITLAAIGIERRVVAIAIFRNTHLDQMLIHHLPSEAEKAENILHSFIKQVLDRLNVEYFAFAQPRTASSGRIQGFHRTAIDAVRQAGVPLSVVPETTALNAYGHPALAHWMQVRKAMRNVFPTLNERKTKPSELDSAAIGLCAQVERIFNIYLATV